MKKVIALALAAAAIQVVPAGAQEGRSCKPEDVSKRLVVKQDTVPRGEAVRFRLIVKNTSGRECTMEFPSGRGGTIRVFQAGHAVWEHGYCRAYTAHLEYSTWPPGNRAVWRYSWKQWENARDNAGRLSCDGKRERATPGRYEVVGEFFGTDPNAETQRESFRITR